MKRVDSVIDCNKVKERNSIPLMDHWFRFTEWVFDRTARFPKSCRFTISSRIDMLMLDGMEKIVEAIGYHKDVVVAARQGQILAVSFHPELTDDLRLHQYFIFYEVFPHFMQF